VAPALLHGRRREASSACRSSWLQGDALTIKGEKKAEEERKGEGYYLAERRYGAFARSLRLPFAVEADKVQATFKNGVLTITMPKPAERQQESKRIEVKPAA
jgi:HSP20 family protein